MPVEICIPNGRSSTAGCVRVWLKREGDAISVGELLANLESDTVFWDLPSPADGVLALVLVPPDDWRPVGTPIALIAVAGEDAAAVRRGYLTSDD